MRSLGGADTRGDFDRLLGLYAPVAGVVVLVVFLLVLIPLWRNRASRRDAASTRNDASHVEAAFAVGLGVVAGVLVWQTFAAVTRVDAVARTATAAPGAPPSGLTIDLLAAKWNWRFAYPGGVTQQGTGPAEGQLPVLVVPAGRVVRFRLRSLDVVHAFWIPATRYKYDAVPGRVSTFDLAFDPDVDYGLGGRCSEFCGTYHEQMRFRVDVRSPRAFDVWLRARQAERARR